MSADATQGHLSKVSLVIWCMCQRSSVFEERGDQGLERLSSVRPASSQPGQMSTPPPQGILAMSETFLGAVTAAGERQYPWLRWGKAGRLLNFPRGQ